MATVNNKRIAAGDRAKIFLWETLTSANAAGDALDLSDFPPGELTAQILGTMGSATLVWQGSLDGVTYVTLSTKKLASIDVVTGVAANVAASQTVAGMLTLLERPRYIKPSTSGGGGTQDIDAYLQIAA